MRKSKRNKSKNIKHGQIVMTEDKYLWRGADTKKSRMTVVAASNKDDELGLVKLYTNGIPVKGDNRFKSYKPYLYITDNDGEPIKIDGKKFKKNKRIMGKAAIKDIVKNTYRNKIVHKEYGVGNKKLFKRIKKRSHH